MEGERVMGAARSRELMSNGRSFCRRFTGRPMPKRGQVKVAVVLGLVHTVSSIFSLSARTTRRGGAKIS
ncbi:hypothetical protein I3842_09G159700 [Carya illinoinensis]|uniref:Uncharacterized protein n=1 Tax=Carya illinoinensis TaxID=32201 RepID=A0A922E5T9_CARIL|nr:hypothetical protein I3842_09G159700 [Carya illinoinensis]